MLKLSSVMIGSMDSKPMAEFYEKVFEKKPDMQEGDWAGWQLDGVFFSIGAHSEVKGTSKDPSRIMFNLETKDVKKEFDRIKAIGATVIKEPYSMEGMENSWIATFADPDGNYFQLMTPWEQGN